MSGEGVKVSPEVLEVLHVHLVSQGERFELQQGQQAPEYIFTTSTGRWLDISNVSARPWARTLRAAGLSWRKPHEMRHTYASILISRSVSPCFVKKQFGHADVA